MDIKICLITGATSGIGYETALGLARREFDLILVGRNQNKCKKVKNKIFHQAGNSNVDYFVADLSDKGQIQKLAGQIRNQYNNIDVLVNNAGAYFLKRFETIDGYEMSFALNHLNYFLLTNLLIDTLVNAAPSRIINVSSVAHKRGNIHFDDIHFKSGYNGFDAYAQSKLANILFTKALAKRLKDQNITVNALHPGNVASSFGKNNGLIRYWVKRLIKRNFISSAKGAETTIYLATSDEVSDVTGEYFVDKKIAVSSALSNDEELGERLWELSADLTGL
jgi:retinol dehydrogenase-12